MAKVRQDAWSHEDDLLLAETVLRHVREGSTQLKAFEEVGDQLNRTSAACGFRWNAEVRGDYVEAMELAKRQRKERKRSLAKATKTKTSTVSNVENESLSEHITLQRVITFLQQLDEDTQANQQAKLAIKRLEKENKSLKEEIEQLQNKLDETKKQFKTIKEDHEPLIKLMKKEKRLPYLMIVK